MSKSNRLGTSVHENDYDTNGIDNILSQNDSYILSIAREKIPSHITSPEVLDLEIQELAQRSRIKLWRMLQTKHITHIKAYLRCIVHSESVDMVRRYKSNLPLPINEEGELYQGSVLVAPCDGMQDPLYELEKKETATELIEHTAEILRSLPPCQKQVMLCFLKDQLDDVLTFTTALKKFEINIDTVNWPSNKKEVQKLKASLSPVRKKLHTTYYVSP